MAEAHYWADRYVEIKLKAMEAIRLIKPGQRVFIGSSCGEPQALVRALAEASAGFSDLEVIRLLALETTPLTLLAGKSSNRSINIRSFYLGSAYTQKLAKNRRYITPMNLSAVPKLFKSRKLPIHVALIQVSPPDDFGWMSLGVSVDITLAAAQSADLVIAQVNAQMPRVLGMSFIHVNDVDVIVERNEEIVSVEKPPDSDAANRIAQHVKRFIEDGSTIQIGLGTTPQSTIMALSDKNDLGIHTQYLTEEIMKLVSMGVVTNRKKGFNDGKLVAASAIGSSDFYEYLDDNPAIEFHPADYVCDPNVISRHHKMIALNVGMMIDLTGQAAADAIPLNHFSGATALLDFTRGAAGSEGGKSILMITSTSADGKRSHILPTLNDVAVVVPRGDIHYVATEYGGINLFGKSLQERAMAMISIAHPNFREWLFEEAKKAGLIDPSRKPMKESLHGVYPVQLEEVRQLNGETLTIRPAKPVDVRKIQEHFYNLTKDDIISRFFHEKTQFMRDEVEGISQIDYIKNLTMIAIIGEPGFGRVVAVGEYLLEPRNNTAEVAFSVSRDYQGKGLGKMLMAKLAEAARENGIAGLVAYTNPDNRSMIRLFKTLPYKVKTAYEEDMVVLNCRFDELAEKK